MVNDLKQRMNILRYPRLDTVLMVEETIQKLDYYPKKMELWKALPKKMMYQTFCVIIDYLIENGKVMVKDSQIIWTWDPEGVRKILAKKELIIR